MKHFGKIAGALFAMLLAFASLQAQAATKAQDREFNHMSTGFPLAGVHATTSCESCHVGGVFVGTPRACDGCHATGKRVVATPKSLKHIVTDAPCETCHFNTSTFYGARYNHGTAVPGQCTNCHNGRIVEGMPRNHPVSPVVGASCDSCHRSSSWLPASWNHTDTGSDCSVCHTGSPGRTYTSARHTSYNTLGILATCRNCHTNYYTFSSYYYNHIGAASTCGTCHQNTPGIVGVTPIVSTTAHANYASALISQCSSCHKSFSIGTFAAGRYDHAGAGTCDTCHSGHAGWSPAITQASTARHNVYNAAYTAAGIAVAGVAPCSTCHSSTAAWAGSRFNHTGATNCTTCHQGNTGWNTYIRQMSANHIPFTGTCTNCHSSSGTSWGMAVNSVTLHNYVTTSPCTTCHLTGNQYSGNGQQTKRVGHEGMGAADDCSKSGCHAPAGGRGTAYRNWD